jgi:hypothetical protein
MFSLDVGLRAHEDLVPNEFQSADWPALRSGVGTTSWTGGPGFMGWVHSKPLPPGHVRLDDPRKQTGGS